MRYQNYIPARIVYPDLSKFVSDDGKRFFGGYGSIFNELLDAIKVNASISKSFFGSCDDKQVCTETLKLFQTLEADFFKLPVPIIVLGNLDNVVKVGPTSYQMTHALGSVTPSINTTKFDMDLLNTVKADQFSIAVFLALPMIIYLINYFHRKIVMRLNSNSDTKTERGAVVVVKLIRILLNQPNYTPNNFTMRIMICLCLLSTLFVLTVYRNIFGSDLTVTDSAVDLDTIDQFNNSDRFVIYDPTKTTKQMIFSLNDPISKLIQSRTIPIKSDYGMLQINLVTEELIAQKAVTITNLYYHVYLAGGYCQTVIEKDPTKSWASKYHLSKETFLPTVTTYVYGYKIDDELKYRLDRVLNIYLEYGLEDFQSGIKPRIAFKAVTGSDDTYFCTQKKEVKEESYPKKVGLKALKKTFIGCSIFGVTAMFVLILEKFTRFSGNVLQMRSDKKRKKMRRLSRKRIKTISYDIKQNVDDDDEQLFTRCWKPCQVEHLDIEYNLPITNSGHVSMTNSGSCHESSYEQSEWKPADIVILELKDRKWRKIRK